MVTNLLVYYTPFEQAVAAANRAAMLGPGGVLVTNDALLATPALRLAGQIAVEHLSSPRTGDTLYWYRP